MSAAPTYIYTLSLHDALPISDHEQLCFRNGGVGKCLVERSVGKADHLAPVAVLALVAGVDAAEAHVAHTDRKSTRLNSSHRCISYAVFCLKKKIDGNDENERQ